LNEPKRQTTTDLPDDSTLQAAEQLAVRAVTEAGTFISERFGGPLEVMQKADREGVDIVTDVDKASQKLIVTMIETQFPEHQILGEEDPPENEPPPCDFVWAIDPIDGTKNFVNGSTIHAVSVGLLYRGVSVAGAIWTPWPGERGHALIHARAGNGTWMDGTRVNVDGAKGNGVPEAGRLAAVPGGLRGAFDVEKPLQGNFGEIRMTGSTCYEMMMVAIGTMQYALNGYSSVWDYAAGLVLVREAGGVCMTPGPDGWEEITGWQQFFTKEPDSFKKMRAWKGHILSSSPSTARFVSTNLTPKRRPGLLKRAWRNVTR
jgi:myo-inositol-1(or 4)-monophosphatase